MKKIIFLALIAIATMSCTYPTTSASTTTSNPVQTDVQSLTFKYNRMDLVSYSGSLDNVTNRASTVVTGKIVFTKDAIKVYKDGEREYQSFKISKVTVPPADVFGKCYLLTTHTTKGELFKFTIMQDAGFDLVTFNYVDIELVAKFVISSGYTADIKFYDEKSVAK